MMKKVGVASVWRVGLVLSWFCCFLPASLWAQYTAGVWLFGNKAGIDFYTGNPRVLRESSMHAPEGCASIADSAGKLLFYTNGQTVWNAQHLPMANGDSLAGDPSSTQSALIVPFPGHLNQFYLFTTDRVAGTKGLQYSLIDMNLNGGLGAVIEKNVPLFSPVAEKLTAVQHANGIDFWILTHEWGNNAYQCWRLTGQGLDAEPVVSNVGTPFTGSLSNALGAMKFSPDGRFAACAQRYDDYIDWLAFNDQTGQLSLLKTFTQIDNPYGIEFSPDGGKLYVSSHFFDQITRVNVVSQIDLTKPNTPIVGIDSFSIPLFAPDVLQGALQLAPDGKIYSARQAGQFLGVVHNPNAAGATCNYAYNGFSLEERRTEQGLPNVVQSFLKEPLVEMAFPVAVCTGRPTPFAARATPAPDSYEWNFGDPASGAANASSLPNPEHQFTAPGVYSVKLKVKRGAQTFENQKFVTVYAQPVDNLGPDRILCRGQVYTLDAGNPGAVYIWSNGLTTRSFTTELSDRYEVRVTNGDCTELFGVDIQFAPGPQPELGEDATYCGVKALTLDAGVENVAYLWNTGETTKTILVKQTGQYFVDVFFGECQGSDSIRLTLYKGLEVDLGGTRRICMDKKESLVLDAGEGAGYQYQWNTGATSRRIDASKPGWYRVTVTDADGCAATDSAEVQVDCFNLIAPTVFSPNGDNLNDAFRFFGLGVQEFEYTVYDLSGSPIFRGKTLEDEWDGSANGQPCPEGWYVYRYHIRADYRGSRYDNEKSGQVLIVR